MDHGMGVVIGTGAEVLGPVKIGDNTRIGANSVVISEIPPHSIVVGIPGKVVFRVEGEKRIALDREFAGSSGEGHRVAPGPCQTA